MVNSFALRVCTEQGRATIAIACIRCRSFPRLWDAIVEWYMFAGDSSPAHATHLRCTRVKCTAASSATPSSHRESKGKYLMASPSSVQIRTAWHAAAGQGPATHGTEQGVRKGQPSNENCARSNETRNSNAKLGASSYGSEGAAEASSRQLRSEASNLKWRATRKASHAHAHSYSGSGSGSGHPLSANGSRFDTVATLAQNGAGAGIRHRSGSDA